MTTMNYTLFSNSTDSSVDVVTKTLLPSSVAKNWLPSLVYRVTIPIILVVGTVGNVMMIAVLLYTKAWKSAFNVVLLALAFSDQTILINIFFSRHGATLMGYNLIDQSQFLCVISPWVWFAFDMCSAYLLVVLSMQRTVSVIMPHYVGVLCTRRKSITLIGCVLFTSLLTTSPALHKERILTHMVTGNQRCFYLFHNPVNVLLSCNQMVVVTGVPFSCLLISNAVLGWHLMLSVRSAGTGGNRQKQASSTTVTVIVLSFVFLVSSLPLTISEVYYLHHPLPPALLLVTQNIKYVNNVSNFYLYCLTGTKFRNQLKTLIKAVVCRV